MINKVNNIYKDSPFSEMHMPHVGMKQKRVYTRTELSMQEALYYVQCGDEQLQNYLLVKYHPFIAKCVSEVCSRYIDPKVDDEYSIGLCAFYEAMLKYCPTRGKSFFSFANVVVKRKVIDYIRYTRKGPQVVSINTMYKDEARVNQGEIVAATENYLRACDRWCLKEELKDFQQDLQGYRICLKDLIKVSPKHEDARKSAARIARMLYEEEHLNKYVKTKKKLPLKLLHHKVEVSKKTLERQRKFILAMFIILNEDYLHLKHYIKYMGR